MLAMVSGSVGFAPNPADGLIFFFEPVAAAGADDRQEHRRARLAAGATRPCSRSRRCCSSRRRCSRWPAGWRERRCASTGIAPDGRPRPAGRRRPTPAPRAAARRGRGAAPPGGSPTASASRSAGSLGLLFCAIAVAIVVYLLVQGLKYVQPRAADHAAAAGFSQSETGGFLDPLLGTVDRRRDGDRDRAAGRRRRSPSGWSSTAARSALARIAESTIEAIAGIPSIVLALFGTVIFSSTGARLPQPRRPDGRRLRPLVLRRLGDALAGRPAADRRQHARGAAGDPAARARGLLRGRQDEDRDDAADPAAGGAAAVATGAMLGLGRIIGDTAIIVVLLGATLNFDPAERRLRCSTPCAAPAAR